MKTIKITDDYFIRVTKQNYTVCKLVKRESEDGKVKETFMYPSYHTSFLSAVENIQQRMFRDGFDESDVKDLKSAVDVIREVNGSLKELIKEDLKDVVEENYDAVNLDEDSEEEDSEEIEE